MDLVSTPADGLALPGWTTYPQEQNVQIYYKCQLL
jgi:hypothetical protein